MAKAMALITIHGMGETKSDYYSEFVGELKKHLEEDVFQKIIFKHIYYQPVLEGNQAEVFRRMRDQIDWMRLRKFMLFGFSDAASLEHKKDSIGSPYFLSQKIIMDTMDEIFDEAQERMLPVVVLAQSLGCQVMSNYLWDADPERKVSAGVWSEPGTHEVADGSPRDNFRRMRSLQRFYTTGCNIPIFVSGHKNIEAITAPNSAFKWHNFFDEDDVLGWPLRPLSASYYDLVEDFAVNSGGGIVGTLVKSWNPFSHEQYWSDGEVVSHLSSTIRAFV